METRDILGLISLEDHPKESRVEIRLLAVSKENRGRNRKFEHIAGNLIAFACMRAITQFGEWACVSLVPKSQLIEHYTRNYSMIQAGRSLFTDGIDSRNLKENERELEKDAILNAREARFRNRSEHEKKVARLLQLKYQMEDYLNESGYSTDPHFSKFLNIYVDILYKKRKDFASDLSIDPIMLSQVMNNHRDPQETFMHRLIIHAKGSYKKVCTFNQDLWPRIFYQDKVCKFLSTQEVVRDSEEKYVTPKRIEP